jgi:hypothetical protein
MTPLATLLAERLEAIGNPVERFARVMGLTQTAFPDTSKESLELSDKLWSEVTHLHLAMLEVVAAAEKVNEALADPIQSKGYVNLMHQNLRIAFGKLREVAK